MTKSDLFPSLNEIIFASKDVSAIEREVITLYESLSDRTLARADPVRLFLETIALIITQQRNIIDYTGKMNLLAYALGDYLDHKGAFLNVFRLEAAPSVTTIEFTLSEGQDVNIIIPQGTRLTAGDNIYFATNEALTIESGELTGQVKASCTVSGTIGNGYLPGQIKRIVDVFPYEMHCVNITESAGGTELESDENLRERIHLAPESFTTAGSTGAYIYFTRTANSDIADAAVMTPSPGHVNIYPLMTGGELPPQEVLEQVQEFFAVDDLTPDTDLVHVLSPVEVEYSLNVKYYINQDDSTQSAYISSKIQDAIESWIKWQHGKLGRDINPSELNYRIIQAGAKRCEITSPEFQILEANEIASCTSKVITYGGLEEL